MTVVALPVGDIGQSPFAGADVCAEAGLSLPQGAPPPASTRPRRPHRPLAQRHQTIIELGDFKGLACPASQRNTTTSSSCAPLAPTPATFAAYQTAPDPMRLKSISDS
jgi:hypothetical protein